MVFHFSFLMQRGNGFFWGWTFSCGCYCPGWSSLSKWHVPGYCVGRNRKCNLFPGNCFNANDIVIVFHYIIYEIFQVIYCPKKVQLICLSATVANPDELAGWIGQVFCSFDDLMLYIHWKYITFWHTVFCSFHPVSRFMVKLNW